MVKAVCALNKKLKEFRLRERERGQPRAMNDLVVRKRGLLTTRKTETMLLAGHDLSSHVRFSNKQQTTRHGKKNPVLTLADCELSATAPGLKSLRLPRARPYGFTYQIRGNC